MKNTNRIFQIETMRALCLKVLSFAGFFDAVYALASRCLPASLTLFSRSFHTSLPLLRRISHTSEKQYGFSILITSHLISKLIAFCHRLGGIPRYTGLSPPL